VIYLYFNNTMYVTLFFFKKTLFNFKVKSLFQFKMKNESQSGAK